jgi:hypothetical protein
MKRPTEILTRYDNFEPGDTTALVCIDEPEIQQLVVGQLQPPDYKVHTGLFVEDIILKLRTNVYDIVVVYEHFNHSDLESNQVLKAAIGVPASQRRQQLVVLVGPSAVTGDEMQAFVLSVDLVCSLNDLSNFALLVRRALPRYREFFHPLRETLKQLGV